MKPVPYNPDSEAFDELVREYVLANRVNDVLAAPRTKRRDTYLRAVRAGFVGDEHHDYADQYRERAKVLVPRALDAYEHRHGVKVGRCLFFRHSNTDLKIGAMPDGIDGPMLGLTVHVRTAMETYERAVERGLDTTMVRESQIMMLLTQRPYWVHLNYFEDPERRIRRLSEHDLEFDEIRAKQIEGSMIEFLYESRTEAA